MPYNEEDIKSYCGNCKLQFDASLYKCPKCGSNLVNYNTGMRTEKFAVQDRWERHNKNFNKDNEVKDQLSLMKYDKLFFCMYKNPVRRSIKNKSVR